MNGVETYWRGGYTVKGATDVIVERYGRSRELAAKAAESEAEEAVVALKTLGVESEVQIWTEKWKSVTKISSEQRVVERVVEIERRRDVVEK